MAKKAEIDQTEIEAPYELPEGWKWCRLGDVADCSKEKTEVFSQDMKYVGLEHIDSNGKINGWSSAIDVKSLKNVFHKDQVLYGKLRPYLNKHDIADFDGVCSTDILVFNAKTDFSNKYINYFFNLPYFIDFVVGSSKGINLPRVSEKTVLDSPFPLPPTLAEQKRIVRRIETLFAKLDEAEEKTRAVLDGFETRKAAILHKAFTGELTAKWRKENGVSDDSWEEKKLGDVVKLLSGQDFKPEDYNDSGNGIPYITGASNFDVNHVIINRWTPKPSIIAKRNDVLLVCKGSGYGKTIIADFEEAHVARQIMAIRVDDSLLNAYALFFLQDNYEYLRNGGQGLIPGIARNVVLNMKIQLPSIPEQQETVRILNSMLGKEFRAKEAAQTVLDQIALLKKSILARAFRGEL